MLSAIAVLVGAIWLLKRGERALAFVAVGVPLLDPIMSELGLGEPLFVASRVLLLAALIIVPIQGFLGLPRPDGRSSFRVLLEPTIVFALLLGLVLRLGLVETPSAQYGADKTLGYFLFTLPLLFAAAILLARPASLEVERERHLRFFKLVLWFEVLIALAGVHNHYMHYYPWRFRLVSLGMNPIWVGRHAGQGLLLVIAFVSVGWMRRGLGLVLAGLLALVLWWSGSRGVLLSFMVAMGVWFLAETRVRRWIPLALVFAGAALGLVLLSFTNQGGGEGALPFLNRIDSNFSRTRLIDVAKRTLAEIGFFGAGTGGFAALARVGDIRYYPHNIFLEVGLENGIPGLAVLFGFFAATLMAARRALARACDDDGRTRLRLALALFVFQLVNAQFSGDITANEWIWLWSGVILAFARSG